MGDLEQILKKSKKNKELCKSVLTKIAIKHGINDVVARYINCVPALTLVFEGDIVRPGMSQAQYEKEFAERMEWAHENENLPPSACQLYFGAALIAPDETRFSEALSKAMEMYQKEDLDYEGIPRLKDAPAKQLYQLISEARKFATYSGVPSQNK